MRVDNRGGKTTTLYNRQIWFLPMALIAIAIITAHPKSKTVLNITTTMKLTNIYIYEIIDPNFIFPTNILMFSFEAVSQCCYFFVPVTEISYLSTLSDLNPFYPTTIKHILTPFLHPSHSSVTVIWRFFDCQMASLTTSYLVIFSVLTFLRKSSHTLKSVFHCWKFH